MPADAVNTVVAFIEAVNRHVPSEVASLMTEDHAFVDSQGRTTSGRQTMAVSWKQYFQMFPDYKIRVEIILEENGVVAVFGSASGTFNGKRGMVEQNKVEMPAAWKAMVVSAKVKIWQVYADWTEGTRIITEDAKLGDRTR